MVGFTAWSNNVSADEVLLMLNDIYKKIDIILQKYNLYNLDIIADCYVCVAGLFKTTAYGGHALSYKKETNDPSFQRDEVQKLVNFGLDVLKVCHAQGSQMRIGVHCGPVVSGILGTRIPKYTLLGDTMNTASRMESCGCPGKVNVSRQIKDFFTVQRLEGTYCPCQRKRGKHNLQHRMQLTNLDYPMHKFNTMLHHRPLSLHFTVVSTF